MVYFLSDITTLALKMEGDFDGHSPLWWMLIGATMAIALIVVKYFINKKK